ncbi:unnamed protein product [Haemonchus placei]|uniref:Ubiquitin-like domain-containing protein n=1 Tax=Haemonchus placei TaxID=6290 RepID=A0A0N4WDA9_HAEPC|nr:unnamed protein product [Haemonchus placei]
MVDGEVVGDSGNLFKTYHNFTGAYHIEKIFSAKWTKKKEEGATHPFAENRGHGGCSSDSDEDLYTHSVDIRKVRATVLDPDGLCKDLPNGDNVTPRIVKPDIIPVDDDDSDSLDLSDPENLCPKKAKESSKRRRKRMEQEQLQELDEILHEPIVTNVVVPKRIKRCRPAVIDLCQSSDILNDSIESIESNTGLTSAKNAASGKGATDSSKEVDLFVTVNVDHEAGKPGRFMTIRRDEPFDKLRPAFARELKCHQLDVLIHVNKVDAGPGDTPDSMGLDLKKLALVNVFSLKSGSTYEEDLANDPNFIAVKCIFANSRPRCVYISLTEPFSDAKKRIAKELKLTQAIDKLVFDSEVLNDGDNPGAIGMEADDVIEIHLKK